MTAPVWLPRSARVRRLKVGDEVYSYNWENPKGGFYAKYVAVPADKAAPIPKRLDLRQAGAIPTTSLTALQGIDDALKLKKGETVIIHGASGGDGVLAVQFARLRGAKVSRRRQASKGWSWAGRTQIYHALGVGCPSTRPAFSAASWARADQSRSP
jgi:NADPH:quinone reductase-like Zn-dependent oxidoreductase